MPTKILAVSGSSRSDSSNTKLLKNLASLFPEQAFYFYPIKDLPLFETEKDHHPWEKTVLDWRKTVAEVDAVIFCTPEYLHNIPALLKNALEWLSSSGELMQKKVLALTFTPHEPRGKKAMQSLLWSLQALNAQVVGQLALYQTEIKVANHEIQIPEEIAAILEETIAFL